jgi:hypothetical protein
MKNLIKKVLREFTEENEDVDYRDLSFAEAVHVITKILPPTASYKCPTFMGTIAKYGSKVILYDLELFSKHDPEVRFDIIETENDPNSTYSTNFNIKIHSDKIKRMMERPKNLY